MKMNKLNTIKNKKFKKPGVWLENVHFDFDKSEDNPLGAHIHYVTNAASLRDDPLLLKSLDELSEDEIKILDEINKKQKEEIMDEKVVKELEDQKKINEDLQKKLDDAIKVLEESKIEKAKLVVEKSLEGIPFEEAILKEISPILVGIEDEKREIIVKAFASLNTKIVELEGKVEKEDDNSIAKKLEKEAGVTGEEPVEKSLNDRIAEYRK